MEKANLISKENFKSLLKEKGLKLTAPRFEIYRELQKANKPLAYSDLIKSLEDKTWDQATLYRNLIKLTEKGLLKQVTQIGGIQRYQIQQEGTEEEHLHAHFLCNDCGELSCVPEEFTLKKTKKFPEWSGILAKAELNFRGTCFSCQ